MILKNGLDSSTRRAADWYPASAHSNPARVNIFQLTSAMSDYHEKFLFVCISKDDSEMLANIQIKIARLDVLTIIT